LGPAQRNPVVQQLRRAVRLHDGQQLSDGDLLYGVAYHTALKARAIMHQRRAREKQVKELPSAARDWACHWRPAAPFAGYLPGSSPARRNGTKRTGPRSRVARPPLASFVIARRDCSAGVFPTGMTSTPPGLSCSKSGSGT
jgi:hypothetical protein